VKWVISPQIKGRKMKIILLRKPLKTRRYCSRSTIRRKMARLVVLSGIRMQVRISTAMMMRMMRNPPRRVLPALPSRKLITLFDTPYCLMAKGEPKVCEIDEFTYDDFVEMVSNLDDLLGDMKGKYKNLKKKHVSP
jgi:hypothetical protein